jgi:hypothetical protein
MKRCLPYLQASAQGCHWRKSTSSGSHVAEISHNLDASVYVHTRNICPQHSIHTYILYRETRNTIYTSTLTNQKLFPSLYFLLADVSTVHVQYQILCKCGNWLFGKIDKTGTVSRDIRQRRLHEN